MKSNKLFKIIVVGNQNVGKTSLLERLVHQRFTDETNPTVCADQQMKTFSNINGDQVFKVQFWDIAGQERYQSLSDLYVRGASACIIVSDIQDEGTLKQALKWKTAIEGHLHHADIPYFHFQNKLDLIAGELEPFQTLEGLDKFSKENGFIKGYQVSAKDDTNINDGFEAVVKEAGKVKQKGDAFSKPQQGQKLQKSVVLGQNQPQRHKKKCCK